jgi:hypothetical protein
VRRRADNPQDDCAVAVTLTDGRRIGDVPRTDSEDVTGGLEDGGYSVATVKKILTGRRAPIPGIVLQFYRPDQRDDVADLNPDPCPTALPDRKPPERRPSEPRKPWWKFLVASYPAGGRSVGRGWRSDGSASPCPIPAASPPRPGPLLARDGGSVHPT